MLTFSVLALGVKEIRLCDDTDFDVDCSFNLRILSVDLNYKKHIVSLSVNNSCHDTKKKVHSCINIWAKNITVLILCAILICGRCILWFKKLKSNFGTGRVKKTSIVLCVLWCRIKFTRDCLFCKQRLQCIVLHCWSVQDPVYHEFWINLSFVRWWHCDNLMILWWFLIHFIMM